MAAAADIASFRRDLLDARRVFGVTDGSAWFIRIHETLDAEALNSGRWLADLGDGLRPGPASPAAVSGDAGWRVSRLEKRHRHLWFSVYLHEYCHFLQLATTPYFHFLHTLWQYQIHLAAALAGELAGDRGRAVPPFRAAASAPGAARGAHETLRRWDHCAELLRWLHDPPAGGPGPDGDPLAVLAEVGTGLEGFNADLRSHERPARRLTRWLRERTARRGGQEPETLLPLLSWQPGLAAAAPRPATADAGETFRQCLGGRAVAEGAAAAIQFLYLAGTEGWDGGALAAIDGLAGDEQVAVLAAAGRQAELQRLDRSWRPFVLWSLCDLALQTPLHPVYRAAAGRGRRAWRWEDLHPGLRFERVLAALSVVAPPAAGPAEVAALTGDQAEAATRRAGAALAELQRRLAATLGWPAPEALAARTRGLRSRADDFLTRLRAQFAGLVLDRPGLALLPLGRETHRVLAPLAVFAGPELRDPPAGEEGRRVTRILANHLLHHGARQAMERDGIDVVSEASLAYHWSISADFLERARELLARAYRLDAATAVDRAVRAKAGG